MGEPALKTFLTYAEYKEFEDSAEERHIFWDGEVFSVSGASDDHNTIESNVHGAFYVALQGRPCRASTGNRRLRALHSDKAVYADAIVICGKPILHPNDKNATTNPVVIVEVLSDSTESFDRGDKFTYYRSFPSVRAVLFVSQKAIHVERFTREENGGWALHDFGAGETLRLDAIDVSLAVNALYEESALRVPLVG